MEISKTPGTPSQYAQAMRMMLRSWRTAEDLNRANHMALESGRITLDHFLAAARVLAEEALKSPVR